MASDAEDMDRLERGAQWGVGIVEADVARAKAGEVCPNPEELLRAAEAIHTYLDFRAKYRV